MNLRKIFASLVTVTMMVALVPQIASAQTFSDVPSSHTFYNDIEAGVAAGYFSTANSMFNPNMTASRGEMSKMLAVAANLGDGISTGHMFTDVPETNVFYPYVMKLANNGIVSLNDEFNIDKKVTRAELAKMVVGAFGFEEDLTGAPAFSDVAANSDFYSFIHTAKNNGVVNGYSDGSFGPTRNVTRAEAAAFMNRALGGEYGEATHITLTASSESVGIGETIVLNASVRDDQERLVRNAEGAVTFTAQTGVLEDASVDVSFGGATTTLTSEFAIEDLEVTATYGDWDETIMVNFNIGDNGLSVYLIDEAGYADSDTYGIVSLVDENNVPVNGAIDEFIVQVLSGKGDMIVEDFTSTSIDGVYLFELSNGNLGATSETNVVQVEHTPTGRIAQTKFEIEDAQLTVRVGNSDISTLQATPVMIMLNDASGAPIVGAEDDITVTVLNSEHGVLNVSTAADSGVTSLNPEPLTDRGVYIAEFQADNRMATALIKVSYRGQTPVITEEVEIAIHPMDIQLMIPQDTANTFNGYYDVIVMVKDVNGMPVVYDTNYLDLDITSGVSYTDPTGDDDWNDLADWASEEASGLYTTRLKMDESPIRDSTIEISIQENQTVNVDTEVTATVSATSPIIDDISFFEATGEYFTVFTVVDSNGSPVTGIESTDIIFEDSDGSPSTAALPASFVELAGGLYIAQSQNTTLADNDEMIIVDEDIEYVSLTDSLITTAGTYFITSDNSVTNSAGDAIASTVGVLVAGGLATDPTFTIASDNTALAVGTVTNITLGGGVVAEAVEASGAVVDEVETVTLTLSYSATSTTKTYSVSPFDVEVVSLDSNSTFTDTTSALALIYDRDGKLVDPIDFLNGSGTFHTDDVGTDFVGTDMVSLDIDGSIDASEVEFRTLAQGLTGIHNPANTVNFSANGVYSPDHLTTTATVSPAGMFIIQADRDTANDDIDEDFSIAVEIYGNDERIDTFTSTLVDVTLDTWLETETTIVRPDADALTAGTVDTGGVNLYALVYNDHGVLTNVDNTLGVSDLIVEGDGDITFDQTEADTADLDYSGTGSVADTVDFNSVTSATGTVNDYTGIRWLTIETGDSEESATLSIYPENNDSDTTEIEFNTVYPTATLITTPMGAMYPDEDNDEEGIIVTMLDQYGNPMTGLSVSTVNPGVTVEIDGDAISLTETTGTSNSGGDSLGSFYSGTYTTDEEGTLSIVVLYNDDATVIESEIESIFLNNDNN